MPKSKLIKFYNRFSKKAFCRLIQLEFFSIEDAKIFNEELNNLLGKQIQENLLKDIFSIVIKYSPDIQIYGKRNKIKFEYTESGEIEEDRVPKFCIKLIIEFSPTLTYKMIDALERARNRVGAKILKPFNGYISKQVYLVCSNFRYDVDKTIDVVRLDEED